MKQQVQPVTLHQNVSSLFVMPVLICMCAQKHKHILIAEKIFSITQCLAITFIIFIAFIKRCQRGGREVMSESKSKHPRKKKNKTNKVHHFMHCTNEQTAHRVRLMQMLET